MNYLQQIEHLIRNNKFEHFFLFKNVLKVYNDNSEINANWIKGNDNSWILGFCANNNYNIYGIRYSEEMLDSVINELNFDYLPNNHFFSGSKTILNRIFSSNTNIKYNVFKDRFFYEVQASTFKPCENPQVIVRKANLNDVNIISKYNCTFFEEEYNGENNKELSEMQIEIKSKIEEGKFHVAEKSKKVIGFCSRMDNDFNNEMVGTIFIDKIYRNKNYGKYLLSEVTRLILNNSPKCWLMTDMKKIGSNKMTESLGYKIIFEYSSGFMEKQ